MKKVFSKIIMLLLVIVFVSGCEKEYKKLSYVDYNEYFSNKEGYVMIDHSLDSGLEMIRNLEAGNGDIQVMYIEFMNDEEAENYIEEKFNDDNYKIKKYDDYITIKNTKNRYFKLYKIDNVVIYAVSTDKKDKKEINSVLKDLGY